MPARTDMNLRVLQSSVDASAKKIVTAPDGRDVTGPFVPVMCSDMVTAAAVHISSPKTDAASFKKPSACGVP